MDDALLQIRLKQNRLGFKSTGTSLGRRSCAAIASAFGGRGVDVVTRAELADAVELGLGSDIPTLIGVRVDPSPASEWFEALRG
jgi:thiamine pyrophosphate-dependent acetolactate synthase large subunit-like protein